MSSLIKNRKRKYCFDGWEHYSYTSKKWMCGRQISSNKNSIRGIRYIDGISILGKNKKSRRLV